MKNQMKNQHPAMKMAFNTFIELPTPSSISYMWNWGSLLGMMLVMQMITGIFLASHYNSSIDLAFDSVNHLNRNVSSGYVTRFMHMNGASLFFIIAFIHISRGFLFSSFKLKYTWSSGTMILLLLMGTSFLGYVLPWGQMSFWGATVITNLISAIPYMGMSIVQWLWGGFSISMATLSRFFALHFLMPFVLAATTIIHLASLHTTGSNKPSSTNPNTEKISFHPYFSMKDSLGFIIALLTLMTMSMAYSFTLGGAENFNPANPLNTPTHIQPEWYFLFAYAILRSIPNKLGGVVALVASIVMIVLLSTTKKEKGSKKFMPQSKMIFWVYSLTFLILSWIGANPVEEPYEMIGKIYSMVYFVVMLMN